MSAPCPGPRVRRRGRRRAEDAAGPPGPWLAALAALCVVTLTVAATPALAATARPAPSAPVAVLVDARSGEVLFARRADERRPIASATKLMTALLLLERAPADRVFTAVPYRALAVESKIGLRPGERMTAHDLLTALMLESANDAAVTVATGVAGSRPAFVAAMNRRASELGLTETKFSNPIGLDSPGNHSSARDLSMLARRLMVDRRFAQVVNRPRARLRTGARPRLVANRNSLVERYPFVDGVKTGHTRAAGYVLVGSASGKGVRVVSVVMGEPSEAARDADTVTLLRYGLDQFRTVSVFRAGRPLAYARIGARDGERVALTTPADVSLTVRRGDSVERRPRAPDELHGPLRAGERVGSVALVQRGRVIREVPLVTASAVPASGLLDRLGSPALRLTPFALVAIFVAGALIALRVRARRAGEARQ